jgi:hypothetical protein
MIPLEFENAIQLYYMKVGYTKFQNRNAYIESVVSKMNICSDGRSKLLTLNLEVELCAKIN